MANDTKTRILFVDDEPQILRLLQAGFRPMREQWDVAFADSGADALALMAREPFDVLVSDMNMPGMNGAALLNQVMRLYPDTARFILSGYADEEVVTRCVGSAHQFFAKPFRLETLKAMLQRMEILRKRVRNPAIRTLATQKGSLPSVPRVYFQIMEALQSPACSVERISEIVASDSGLTAKLLQLVNSAFFGFARDVSVPSEAVLLLGVERIRSLSLMVHIFEAFDTAAAPGFAIDRLWQHSLRVAHSAQQIARMETSEAHLAAQSYTAGLLHDIGKLILAYHGPQAYGRVLAEARSHKRSLVDEERQQLQATHADAGAYLLSLWGLPTSLGEAAAYHHDPSASQVRGFNPLMAVHVANVLDHERNPAAAEDVPSQLDVEYLRREQREDRMPIWRDAPGKAS